VEADCGKGLRLQEVQYFTILHQPTYILSIREGPENGFLGLQEKSGIPMDEERNSSLWAALAAKTFAAPPLFAGDRGAIQCCQKER